MPRPSQDGGSTFIGARPSRGATTLLVAVVATFLVLIWDKHLAELAESWLGLIPRYALGPRPWQLLTGAFVPRDFGTALGEVFGIWVFGTAVEQRIGTRRMLTLFGVSHVASSLVVAAVGRAIDPFTPVGGCWPATVALMMAFAQLYGAMPMRMFGMVELKARSIAFLWIGLSLVVALITRRWLDVVGDLTGVATGYAMVATSGGGGMVTKVDLAWQRWRLKRLRRRYKVIPGGRDSGRRYLN